MKHLRARRRKKVRKYIILFTILSIPFPIILLLMVGAKSYQKWEDLDFNSNLSYVYVTSMQEDIEGPYHIRIDEEDDYQCEHYFVVAEDQYIIPIFYLDTDILEQVHKYMEAKKEYLAGTLSEEELAKKRVSAIGRIYKAGKSDHIPDLEKYLAENPEFSQKNYQIVPYVMQCDATNTLLICIPIFLILEMIPVLGVILCRIRATGSMGEKMIHQYIKDMGDSPILRRKIDDFFAQSEVLPGFWLSQEYIAGLYNTNVIFGELRQVVSMYKAIPDNHTGNVSANLAINLTSSPGNIKITFSNQKEYLLQLDREEYVDAILEEIQTNCVWIKTNPEQE